MAGGDATVYLNFGRQIAHHGALEFEDALLRPLSIASRAELFLNRVPLDATGQFVRFPGGFLIADIADPTVTAGFSPLFPVLTALGHAVGSPRAALVVAPLFATLSLVGLWCVARRLGGVHAAWLAATLTAVSLPQIWFAKLSVPETVAQCFVMAGVLAWLVAMRPRRHAVGTRRGVVLGPRLFCEGRSPCALARVPAGRRRGAAADARAVRRSSAPPGPARGVRPRGGPQPRALPQLRHPLPAVCRIPDPDVLSAHAAAGLRPGAGGRGSDGGVAGRGGRGGAPPAGVAVAAVVLGMGRRGRARCLRRQLRDDDGGPARRDDRLAELVRLLAGARPRGAGPHGAGPRPSAPTPHRGWPLVGLLLGVVGLQYLYDPLETGLQMESMRRYVPVVLPLTMLFGALTVVTLLARVAAARYRLGLTLATGALLVGLVARPSLAVVGQPLWDEALAQTAQVARLFPDQAVVLVSPDLAGTHIQTSLSLPP